MIALRTATVMLVVTAFVPVHPREHHGREPGVPAPAALAFEGDIPAFIVEVSHQVPGFPADLALEIAEHESHFNPNAVHVNFNKTVDIGVMQVNSSSLGDLGLADPFDARQNIEAGVGYLQRLWVMFEGDPPQLRREKVECVYAHGARGCLAFLPGWEGMN